MFTEHWILANILTPILLQSYSLEYSLKYNENVLEIFYFKKVDY
jgi:hypothetical protein